MISINYDQEVEENMSKRLWKIMNFSGYSDGGNGQCTDIDECSINGGTCANSCSNYNGGFSCGCPNGAFKVGNR